MLLVRYAQLTRKLIQPEKNVRVQLVQIDTESLIQEDVRNVDHTKLLSAMKVMRAVTEPNVKSLFAVIDKLSLQRVCARNVLHSLLTRSLKVSKTVNWFQKAPMVLMLGLTWTNYMDSR